MVNLSQSQRETIVATMRKECHCVIGGLGTIYLSPDSAELQFSPSPSLHADIVETEPQEALMPAKPTERLSQTIYVCEQERQKIIDAAEGTVEGTVNPTDAHTIVQYSRIVIEAAQAIHAMELETKVESLLAANARSQEELADSLDAHDALSTELCQTRADLKTAEEQIAVLKHASRHDLPDLVAANKQVRELTERNKELEQLNTNLHEVSVDTDPAEVAELQPEDDKVPPNEQKPPNTYRPFK